MESLNRLKSTRPRRDRDFYPTPIELCRAALLKIIQDENLQAPILGLDPGSGEGNWGKVFKKFNLGTNIGVDIEYSEVAKKIYDQYVIQDFLEYSNENISLIYGNPPYTKAQEFVEKSLNLLENKGIVFFLLRLAFLESKKRFSTLYSKGLNPKTVYVLVKRPSFFLIDGKRGTDAIAYAIFLWQKGYTGDTKVDWLDWSYDD